MQGFSHRVCQCKGGHTYFLYHEVISRFSSYTVITDVSMADLPYFWSQLILAACI